MNGLQAAASSLCRLSPTAPFQITKMFASGRWWPQPAGPIRSFSSIVNMQSEASAETEKPESSSAVATSNVKTAVDLPRESAAPVYAKPRGPGKAVYSTTQGKGGELLADYVLFEDSMAKVKVPYTNYEGLTSEERDIYMAHLKAVEEKRLKYRDPATGYTVMTVSQLLLQGKCCGNGCRHCPYGHENAPEEVKRSKKWNGAYYC